MKQRHSDKKRKKNPQKCSRERGEWNEEMKWKKEEKKKQQIMAANADVYTGN